MKIVYYESRLAKLLLRGGVPDNYAVWFCADEAAGTGRAVAAA